MHAHVLSDNLLIQHEEQILLNQFSTLNLALSSIGV